MDRKEPIRDQADSGMHTSATAGVSYAPPVVMPTVDQRSASHTAQHLQTQIGIYTHRQPIAQLMRQLNAAQLPTQRQPKAAREPLLTETNLTSFFEKLREAVTKVGDEVLASIKQTTKDCPYI